MIALDPKQTFEFSLDINAGLPADQRARFICHFLTGRQMAELDRLTDEANTATPAKAVGLLEQAIATGLVNVVPEAGGAARGGTLSEFLTLDELWEVALKMAKLSRLTEIERKKSALQSASAATGKSAGTADRAGV